MMKQIQKKMNKKGFTLVELIIVIAVMAILAAIVIPRMTGITDTFKEKADTRVAENYARQLEVKAQLGTMTTTAGPAALTAAILGEATLDNPKSGGTWFYYHDGSDIYVGIYTGSTLPTAAQVTTPAEPVKIVTSRDNAVLIE